MPQINEHLIVVTGPTAVGKTRIVKSGIEYRPETLAKFITSTDREPRTGERHETDYYFHKSDLFYKKMQDGAFFEYEKVFAGGKHLNPIWYGCERAELQRIREMGKRPISVVDVNGALKLMGKQLEQQVQGYCDLTGISVVSIFITAPIDELIARLYDDVAKGHRKNNPKDIQRRIERMSYELEMAKHFDIVINNSNGRFDFAINEFLNAVSIPAQPLA